MRQDMIRSDIITRLAYRGRFKQKIAEQHTRPCQTKDKETGQTKGQSDKEAGARAEFLNCTNAIHPVLCIGRSLTYDSKASPEQRLCSGASLLEGERTITCCGYTQSGHPFDGPSSIAIAYGFAKGSPMAWMSF